MREDYLATWVGRIDERLAASSRGMFGSRSAGVRIDSAVQAESWWRSEIFSSCHSLLKGTEICFPYSKNGIRTLNVARRDFFSHPS